MMRNLLCIVALLQVLLVTSCDVHEWPELPDDVQVRLRLDYDTEMTFWNFQYDNGRLVEQGVGPVYDHRLEYGRIRHIVRAYPLSEGRWSVRNYSYEYLSVNDLTEDYDCELTMQLAPGNYMIMVWSDLIQDVDDAYFYNPSDFTEITLQGEYKGDTDYRDAFRGDGQIVLTASVVEQLPEILDIRMQRPLAKYEFITTDLLEFSRTNVDMGGCYVAFIYPAFMPDSYDMISDRPNDVAENIIFKSALDQLDETSASLGFDYVFVNGRETGIIVRVGLYDENDRQVALSEEIEVPLKRGFHTLITGSFLMKQTSGGIRIDPGFDGNYNIIIE